ncbi:MAG: HNH endonuclease signature motif containing protein, partial [Burkholderiales bacterium]
MRGRAWTRAEEEILALQYPHMATKVIALLLEVPVYRVYSKATRMGLAKSAEYLASDAACRLRRGDNIGRRYRFPKGHVPANKGLRRPGYAPGNMARGQFKKGRRPHNWLPIGTEVVRSDGYLARKMTDTGYPPRDWVQVHRLNWIAAHGPIPPRHVIRFKDGNKLNTAVENLEMLSWE